MLSLLMWLKHKVHPTVLCGNLYFVQPSLWQSHKAADKQPNCCWPVVTVNMVSFICISAEGLMSGSRPALWECAETKISAGTGKSQRRDEPRSTLQTRGQRSSGECQICGVSFSFPSSPFFSFCVLAFIPFLYHLLVSFSAYFTVVSFVILFLLSSLNHLMPAFPFLLLHFASPILSACPWFVSLSISFPHLLIHLLFISFVSFLSFTTTSCPYLLSFIPSFQTFHKSFFLCPAGTLLSFYSSLLASSFLFLLVSSHAFSSYGFLSSPPHLFFFPLLHLPPCFLSSSLCHVISFPVVLLSLFPFLFPLIQTGVCVCVCVCVCVTADILRSVFYYYHLFSV